MCKFVQCFVFFFFGFIINDRLQVQFGYSFFCFKEGSCPSLRGWTQSLRELAELYVRIRAEWLSQRRSESPRSRHLLHFGQLTKGYSLTAFTFTNGKIKKHKIIRFYILVLKTIKTFKNWQMEILNNYVLDIQVCFWKE